MILRVGRGRFDLKIVDQVDKVLKAAYAEIWPKQEKLPGYFEGYMGIDRVNGAIIWATVWDSVEHGEALGLLPEMVASNKKLRELGLVFEPITSHELM